MSTRGRIKVMCRHYLFTRGVRNDDGEVDRLADFVERVMASVAPAPAGEGKLSTFLVANFADDYPVAQRAHGPVPTTIALLTELQSNRRPK